ncbi:hypothetical protein N781_06955 [Pontibacillus halophilus JSM 076056 = DSM 19796]|uniref:DUF2254 domain-containing protein n=1 Tax=Pontibacillus halophilus JSM 076056 = DSM 19796 TaxID=1385510 RepID=A0A0A5GBJ1_9BACI|nr:DUF2254 domain-containing protein [Pontibacillus halophilus]KGX90526.1 hypothetical protein N781_06955 [Pontibacillus halophilus JSM 076056 = DSM 19796]
MAAKQTSNTSKKLKFSIRDTFWFQPSIYSVLAIVAVAISTALDLWFVPMISNVIPDLFLTNKSIASTLYGALITATLTMTTISFSSIMVVLTTYSSQFSPRTLQDFMTDRITQHVLGVYVFAFLYTLLNLILLTEDGKRMLITPFLTVVVTVISLGFFVLFIHHSARWVQVNNLIGKIQHETLNVIKQSFSDKKYGVHESWNEEEIRQLQHVERNDVPIQEAGYIQHMNLQPFIQYASENDFVVHLQFQVGDYVEKGETLFSYWKNGEKEVDVNHSQDYILVGKERTNVQDIEFSIQKLVEIALRAISPGINDPHTAVNCINRIGTLLAELGRSYKYNKYYTDQEGQLRVIVDPKPYHEYLYKSFYQIRLYGKHDVSVMNGVLESMVKVAKVNGPAVKESVWNFSMYILRGIEEEGYDPYDLNLIQTIVDQLANVCNQDAPNLRSKGDQHDGVEKHIQRNADGNERLGPGN